MSKYNINLSMNEKLSLLLLSSLLLTTCSGGTHSLYLLKDTIYVDGRNGDDNNSGLSWKNAVKTIQKGLDLATDGMRVVVADGIYSGDGNRNLDFKGKSVHLLSAGGASSCIIDCGHNGRAFYFHSGEGNDTIVEGFTIRNGSVREGGGIGCFDSSPKIAYSVIENNSADYGAGIYVKGSSPIIENCAIENNSAENYGGGICARNNSNPIVRNCLISGNRAGWGAGIYSESSGLCLTGGLLMNNIAESAGGGIGCWNDSSCVIKSVDIVANRADYGGGIYSYLSSISVADCHIADNEGTVEGGGLFFYSDENSFLSNSVVENNSSLSGAGIHCGYQASLLIINCRIRQNTAYYDGGGIHFGYLSSAEAVNSEIVANSSPKGGGIYCYRSTAVLINCTISDNSATTNGGGIYVSYECNITLNNTIIWVNTAAIEGAELYGESDSITVLNHCDIGAGLSSDGVVTQNNCISVDPQFTSRADNDYSLKYTSVCIDAGDNDLLPAGITEDIAGNTRIVNGTVDIGAYEYQGR